MAILEPVPPPNRVWTEQEMMRLPKDGYKYELVNGELTKMPGSVRNEEIGGRLIYLLYPFTKGRGVLGGSQAGFWMQNGNLRSPDVFFMRKERLPDGKAPATFGDAAPDLCIEVISPTEEPADMRRKRQDYFASGAEQVWYLYPAPPRLVVYTAPEQSQEYGPDNEIEGDNLLPGFRLRVADFFTLD